MKGNGAVCVNVLGNGGGGGGGINRFINNLPTNQTNEGV